MNHPRFSFYITHVGLVWLETKSLESQWTVKKVSAQIAPGLLEQKVKQRQGCTFRALYIQPSFLNFSLSYVQRVQLCFNFWLKRSDG